MAKPVKTEPLRHRVLVVGGAGVRVEALGDAVTGVELLPLGRPHREGGDLKDPLLAGAAEQIRDYLSGRRRGFRLRHRQAGPDFFEAAWSALARVPYGRVVSYGTLAGMAGRPGAARAVGGAMGRNRLPLLVPCHRVVASDGIGGFGCGLDWKRRLLALEKTRP